MSARIVRSLLLRAGVPLGLVISALLVWQTSTAAFSATTANGGNSWAAGTVALTDDDSGSAMFTANNLSPGATGVRCIQVTYNGTVTAGVKLYVSQLTPGTPNLAPYVQMTVEEGSGGTFSGGCAGFTAIGGPIVAANTPLSTLATTHSSYANGAGTWTTTAGSPGQTRAYRFSYRLDPNTPNSAQGGSVTASFTWEAQTP